MSAAAAQPRRAEHKARTRQTLVDAALGLVAEHGFDAITTDDIAAAAGVSPRTFFRYFATKESVFLFGEDDFITAFTGVYLAQPAQVSEIDAVSASFSSLAPGVVRLHRRIRLYHKALASSHLLRGQEQVHHEKNVARVADALARRRGLDRPDAAADLLAAVTMTTVHAVLVDWAAGPARADLAKQIDERFALLVELVSG